ncbi:MAG: glycosyltransferase family 2 protein [Actinobacteria bacterium]|nr:glycosyltransferase family 2 protein [Actinomycetota bacterium]
MLISVVMPCFNVADTLERTVDSVCGQTFKDFELLAIDDGSSDQTVHVLHLLREHMPAPSELRVLSQDNLGAGAARNLGMREARGDLIAFLDADDQWYPDYLATAAAIFERFPQLGAVCSNSWDEYSNGRRLNVPFRSDSVLVVEDFFKALLDGTMVARTSGISIRTSVVAKAGYMREDLLRAQDYEYWSRIAASKIRWGFSSRPLVLYNGVRGESLSRNPLRFTNAPLPETWSKEIWPLLDGETFDSFRKYYVAWSLKWCWHELQSGLDAQARATAEDAFPRARGCREKLFLLAVRFLPARVHRLTWRVGSPVRGFVRGALKKVRSRRTASEFPGYA